MKAAVLHAPEVLSYQDIPDPEPFGERPVLVRVGAVGVCGSDLLRFKGNAYQYPLVLGHEFSAVVEQVPAGSSLVPGDRVAVFPLLASPTDPLTEIGEPALGSGYDYFGSRRDGGMAELLWVPERNLVPVPASMPLLHAAVVEPAAVALHGVLKLQVVAGGVALVIGAGPIGALAAQWLRILGWSRVLVADVDPRKRAVMADLGFETIDAAGDTVAADDEEPGLSFSFQTPRGLWRQLHPFEDEVGAGNEKRPFCSKLDRVHLEFRRSGVCYRDGVFNLKVSPPVVIKETECRIAALLELCDYKTCTNRMNCSRGYENGLPGRDGPPHDEV